MRDRPLCVPKRNAFMYVGVKGSHHVHTIAGLCSSVTDSILNGQSGSGSGSAKIKRLTVLLFQPSPAASGAHRLVT